MDRQVLERDIYTQKEALLKHLFNVISVEGKSAEDPRNSPQGLGEITQIRHMREGFDCLGAYFIGKGREMRVFVILRPS